MPHFMILCTKGTKHFTKFFDKKDEADSYMMDAECGVGIKAQCYEWNSSNGWYEFLYE